MIATRTHTAIKTHVLNEEQYKSKKKIDVLKDKESTFQMIGGNDPPLAFDAFQGIPSLCFSYSHHGKNDFSSHRSRWIITLVCNNRGRAN